MKTLEGITYNLAQPQEVIDFLKSRRLRKTSCSPKDLSLSVENNHLLLYVKPENKKYFVRKTFLRKLLNWHQVPVDIMGKISESVFLTLLNELLNSIKSYKVIVKLENEEAITIHSELYTEINDLELFEQIKKLNITKISRNDAVTRMFTEKKSEMEILKDDYYGFGFEVVNSETGFSTLSVNHYLIRYICKNGLTTNVNYFSNRRYHYGESKSSMLDFIDTGINKAEASRKRLVEKIRETTNNSSISIRNSVNFKIDNVIGRWQSRRFFETFKWDSSKYELFNFITHKAKNYQVEQRYQLEKIAGEIILN